MKPQIAYRGIYMLPIWSAYDSLESWKRVLRVQLRADAESRLVLARWVSRGGSSGECPWDRLSLRTHASWRTTRTCKA